MWKVVGWNSRPEVFCVASACSYGSASRFLLALTASIACSLVALWYMQWSLAAPYPELAVGVTESLRALAGR